MIHFKTLFAAFSIAVIGLAVTCHEAAAGDYVWARSNWGNAGGPNRPISVMGNGYGGYYVPRNAYGNNYEGQRFTNPNGFIVSGQPTYQSGQPAYQTARPVRMRRR